MSWGAERGSEEEDLRKRGIHIRILVRTRPGLKYFNLDTEAKGRIQFWSEHYYYYISNIV